MTSVGLARKPKPLRGSTTTVRKPHGYQKRGVEHLLKNGSAALFADPGCGKTSIVLRAALALKDAKISNRVLVVAPLRVAKNVWPNEPKEWAGSEWERLAALRMRVLHGKDKDFQQRQAADVYVVNFDGLKWLFRDDYKHFKRMRIDTLVIDESTKVKHTRTLRFKLLKKVLKTFSRRWILTGSPNPNGYMDLFGQIFVVDMGYALGRFITHFRQQYFSPLDAMGWNWALKPGAERAIQKAVAPYVFRLDADDYLELPEIVDNVIRVDLPKEARRVYDELEEEMITLIEGHTITAANVGAAHTKCAQVANGGLYTQDNYEELESSQYVGKVRVRKFSSQLSTKREWVNLHNEKIDAAMEIVEELQGSPCMLVYDFKHDLERIQSAMFRHFERVMPTLANPKETDKIIDDWNADKIPVLPVHPQTVSHGLNMQKGSATHIIWHSLTWNFEDYDQLIRRLRRQGSRHKRIFVHHIVARDTVDEAKLRALKSKNRTQAGFLAALKKYAELRRK